jgi:colanic acid/amylovoran biosynthesis glycosyltransferase
MGAGCPIVASNLPGLGEAVIDGQSGVLVAPGSVTELRTALHRLLADEILRSRLGKGAAERARAYSIDSIGRRYLALLDAIAAGSGTELAV